jgi:3alpha(or 20beta)-hydroxysteroid dehydrogenase
MSTPGSKPLLRAAETRIDPSAGSRLRRLEGKVAIITGAARGQGAREAEIFIAEGAQVVLTDVLESGAVVAAELGEAAMFVHQDVASEDDWYAVVRTAQARYGKIDVLVNNAGIFYPSPIEQTSVADFDRHYQVNQRGVFLGIKTVLEAMKKAGGGSIVNISSLAGLRGYPEMIAYCGTKWAIRGMTKAAARELAPVGIRVNSIHPGLVDTPMLADGLSPDALEQFVAAVPLRRLASSDDVAEIVTFLASDMSSYVTGAEITVDGGLIL